MVKGKNSEKKTVSGWQPLRELALHTPYTMGYLSLMARRKQLKVKKIGRIWYSTMENIKDFETVRRQNNEERKKQLRERYEEKVGKVRIRITNGQTKPGSGAFKLKVVGDTIFDEVQRELEDVLQEIRERERKLRHRYMSHRGELTGGYMIPAGRHRKISKRDENYLEKEKQETSELSEKLIMDLGKLLNTANKIHDDGTAPKDEKVSAVSSGGAGASMEDVRVFKTAETAGAEPDKRNEKTVDSYNDYAGRGQDNFLSVPYNSFPFESDGGDGNGYSPFQNRILLFIAGILVFIAAILLILVILG